MKNGSIVIPLLAALSFSVSGCGSAADTHPPYEAGLDGITVERSRMYVETLASDSLGGRRAGSPGAGAAAEQIALWLEDAGVQPLFGDSRFQTFDPARSPELAEFRSELFKNVSPELMPMVRSRLTDQLEGIDRMCNVLGKIEGANSDEYVVVGAHYDHLGVDPGLRGDDRIFNGADDNASGVAGVLQVARAFAATGEKPRRTVIFALWDAEESALTGSGYFSRTFEGIKKVKAYYNCDMIGRGENGGENRVYYLYTDSLPWIRIAREDVAAYGLKIELENVRYTSDGQAMGGSDHQSFHIRGIPVWYVSTGGHKDVHRPGDEAHKIDYRKMTDISKMVFLTVYRLANPVGEETPEADHRVVTEL